MGLIDNIKKEAIGKNVMVQSTEAAELEKILNNLFFLNKNIEKETEFVTHVMTRGMESQNRVGLHASSLIVGDKDFCVRAQVLSLIYEQLQNENIPPGLKRIFEEGNAIHEKWQRLFIRGGYSDPLDLDKTMYNEEYRISYTPDIICHIPEYHNGKMVGEIKSVNTYQFQKMTHHPSGGKQLQWYMFLTGIHKGFVLNEDKNNQSFKLEVYDYDPNIVAPFIDRAEAVKYYYNRVMKERKLVSRPEDATSPTCKKCDKCNMKEACWGIGKGKVKIVL